MLVLSRATKRRAGGRYKGKRGGRRGVGGVTRQDRAAQDCVRVRARMMCAYVRVREANTDIC